MANEANVSGPASATLPSGRDVMSDDTRAAASARAPADPLADVDWGDVAVAAAILVAKVTRARFVEDAVQEGLRLVLEGERPWDRAGGKTLAEHVAEVAVRADRNGRRSDRRRHSREMVSKVRVALDAGPATPEERLDEATERRRKELRAHQLVQSFLDDPEATSVLDLTAEGVTAVAEQAALSGFDEHAIELARRRIARRAQQIAWQSEEEEAAS
jgi:hypothetical protein